MSDFRYDAAHTGLLLVDPYNDFLSEGGKLWPMVKEVAGEVGLLDHMRSVCGRERERPASGFLSFPIAAGSMGDGEDWNYPNPSQRKISSAADFRKGKLGRRVASRLCAESRRHSHQGALGEYGEACIEN